MSATSRTVATAPAPTTPITTDAAVYDAAGDVLDELREQAHLEQFAVLTTMPSLSTLHCVTSRHDTILLPRAAQRP